MPKPVFCNQGRGLFGASLGILEDLRVFLRILCSPRLVSYNLLEIEIFLLFRFIYKIFMGVRRNFPGWRGDIYFFGGGRFWGQRAFKGS